MQIVILCLLFASLFWLLNALNKTYTTNINYPLQFKYDQKSFIVVNELPQTINLNVTGGGWDLLRKTYWFKIKPFTINIEDPTDTKFILANSLKENIAKYFDNLKINGILTDTLKLDIQKKITKKVKIRLDTASISLKNDSLFITNIEINPKEVNFSGPESMLNEIGDTLWVNISAKNIENDVQETVQLKNNQKYLITLSQNAVDVNIKIAKLLLFKHNLTIIPLNFPSDSTLLIRDNKASLSYLALEKEKNNDTIRIIANFKNLNLKDSTINLQIQNIPSSAKNIKLTPSTIKLKHNASNRNNRRNRRR